MKRDLIQLKCLYNEFPCYPGRAAPHYPQHEQFERYSRFTKYRRSDLEDVKPFYHYTVAALQEGLFDDNSFMSDFNQRQGAIYVNIHDNFKRPAVTNGFFLPGQSAPPLQIKS